MTRGVVWLGVVYWGVMWWDDRGQNVVAGCVHSHVVAASHCTCMLTSFQATAIYFVNSSRYSHFIQE